MPAALTFKQSQVDELRDALGAIPARTAPEPTVTRMEALQQLRDDIRRKVIEDHVPISEIVDALNSKGFKTNARQIGGMVQPPKKRKKAAPARKSEGASAAKSQVRTGHGEGPASASRSSFAIRPDRDDA